MNGSAHYKSVACYPYNHIRRNTFHLLRPSRAYRVKMGEAHPH